MVIRRALPLLIVCISFASLAEASRSVSKFQPTHTPKLPLDALRQAVSSDRESDILSALNDGALRDASETFGLEQQSFIRDWFSRQEQFRAQRPSTGSASLERDEILPDELRLRLQPLPPALERQLPILSKNLRRGIVMGDVVLLDRDTSRIVDLIHGVLQAR